MYGPGPVTPQPKPADPTTAVVLRVIFTVLPVISLGFLAWGSMLYLALMCKRTVDWLLLAVVAGMGAVAFACFAESQNDSDWQADTGAALILVAMFCTAVYFLVADIVRFRRAARPQHAPAAGYPHPNPNPYATGYGVGAPVPPRQGYPTAGHYQAPVRPAPPISGNRGAATPPPSRGTTPASRPSTPPPAVPARPAAPATPRSAATPPPAPRIDQVRAELDELSDYLRKERGDGGSGEGAR